MVASGRRCGGHTWLWCAWVAVSVAWLPSAVVGAEPKPGKGGASAQVEQSINTLVEQQKELAASIAELREKLAVLQGSVAEQREEARDKHEANHSIADASLTQAKEMREEVRGLYVESSGIKGDVAQAVQQIESLDQNLSSFRLSAGIVVAMVIVLQLVLTGLTLRNRG